MGDCIGVIALFILLAIVGWVMDKIIPGKMPYGIIGGIVAAIAGGIIGGWLFGFLSLGPWAQIGDTRYYFHPRPARRHYSCLCDPLRYGHDRTKQALLIWPEVRSEYQSDQGRVYNSSLVS